MTCLDDDQVLRALGGDLAGAELVALDAHLDTCDSCRSLVGAVALGSGGAAAVAVASDELRAGEPIGRYRVAHRLGAGAMGVVYAARDPELDRTVAIKLLRPERAEDGRRLVREAQAMARLSHPNIVAVHDVGARGAEVYVAMERVDGPTLRTWAATRAWPDVLDALRAIGRGLAAAHAAGIIHRDVKPDNVLVGADGRPRIGDFGLARAADDERAAGDRAGDVPVSTLTATGVLLGTPVYMAPEQLRGGAATAAGDQWSFAVMGWELLLGARPFSGDDVAGLRRSIERGPRLDQPRADGPPPRVVAALRRALSIDPAERFPGVAALVDVLALPVRARRWPFVAVGVAAAAAIAVVVIVTSTRDRPPDVCATAVAELDRVWGPGVPARAAASPAVRDSLDRIAARWRTARMAVCRGDGVDRDALAGPRTRCLATRAGELGAIVAELPRGAVVADAIAALPDPDECATSPAVALFAPIPPAQRDAVAAILARVAAARVRAQVDDRAAALADVKAAIADADRLGHRPSQAAAQLAAAEILRAMGRFAPADEAALSAALSAAAGHDDLTAARAWLVRVGVAGEQRRIDRAGEWLPHAAAAVERAGSPPLLDAALANSAGLLALNRGELAAADESLRRALELRSAIAGADVEVARTRSALGHVARLRGDLDGALAHHQAALAIDRAHLGDRHADVGRDRHNLGGILRLRGELDRAHQAYRDALAIRRAALGPDHPEVGLTHNSLGLVALELIHLDEAERELSTALAIFTASASLDRGVALANLARVAAARGDHARAETLAREALAVDEPHLPAEHERIADTMLVVARAMAARGDRSGARDYASTIASHIPDEGIAHARLEGELAELIAALADPTARIPRAPHVLRSAARDPSGASAGLPRDPMMQPGPDAGTATDAGTGSDSGTGTDSGSGTETDSGTGTDTGTGTDSGTDSGTGTGTGTGTGSGTGAGVDAGVRRTSPGVYGSAQGWD